MSDTETTDMSTPAEAATRRMPGRPPAATVDTDRRATVSRRGRRAVDGLALVAASDGRLARELGDVFACIEWAEAEIAAAATRHPHHADAMYHSFGLLSPTHGRMHTEFVHRSHCRELLERVAAGADTRPGTAAEVCCAMLDACLVTPLRSSGFGLYARSWQIAGFPAIPELDELRGHHEALEGSVIDDHEREVRRTLAVADRQLRGVACRGRHHGVEVRCSYAQRAQPTVDD